MTFLEDPYSASYPPHLLNPQEPEPKAKGKGKQQPDEEPEAADDE